MSAWTELVCFFASIFLVSSIDAKSVCLSANVFSGKNCWCLLWIELAFFLVDVFLVSSTNVLLEVSPNVFCQSI